jgi:hypothetical protein
MSHFMHLVTSNGNTSNRYSFAKQLGLITNKCFDIYMSKGYFIIV